ncbi:uncharacterized protein J3R85_014320 [Psidium guajava]|nr:uncharacterized protein J3R85_014320 [Psidium guajava]
MAVDLLGQITLFLLGRGSLSTIIIVSLLGACLVTFLFQKSDSD